jgi:hypothetical protein
MTLQPTAALPVDADLWWIVYLRGASSAASEPYAQNVYFDRKVPNPRRDRMVIVRRTAATSPACSTARGRARRVGQDGAGRHRTSRTSSSRSPWWPRWLTRGVTNVTHLSGPNSVPDPSGQPRRLS